MRAAGITDTALSRAKENPARHAIRLVVPYRSIEEQINALVTPRTGQPADCGPPIRRCPAAIYKAT
jgi:hypothetical protein